MRLNSIELENQLKKQLIQNIWGVIFSTGVLGLFRKESKSAIMNIVQFDELELKELKSLDDYDYWHFIKLKKIHTELFPFYKENQNVDLENPYTYTARIFNQYIKLYWMQVTRLDPKKFERLYFLIHPIFSNKYLKNLVNEKLSITWFDEDKYYDHILYYRSYFEDPLCDEVSIHLISLIDGIDI